MKLKAEKTFYFKGELIEQGKTFGANKEESEQLLKRGLAKKTTKKE